MPKQQGIVGIGLKVDYEKALQQMKTDFQQALTNISNSAQKTGFDADIKRQIKQINDDIDTMSKNFSEKFEEIGKQTINAENFEKYQAKVSKSFSGIKEDISGITDRITELNQKIGLLDGSDIATKMKAQFDEWSQSILTTYKELEQVVNITKTMSGGSSTRLSESLVKDYKETLEVIRRIRKETDELTFGDISDDSLNSGLEEHYKYLQDNIEGYKQLKQEVSSMSKEDAGYAEKRNELRRYSALLYESYDALAKLNAIREKRTDVSNSKYNDLINELDSSYNMTAIDSLLEKWEGSIKKILQKSKSASEQIQGSFDTFQLKDGAIHIPIDIATKNNELKDKVKEIIEELKSYVDNTPIIAKVKLTLDKSSSTGYEKNSDIDKQQVEGQSEPAVDITKAIQKTYRDAAREAKQIVKTEIKNIQEEFENVPIKIKPDTDAFTKDLKKMINSSFRQIAEETSGVKVNEELEKLVSNLKEVSTSLSGNEKFKLGLDEDSIKRITDAIQNMADMIQRAFGVASNDDIAKQWTTIESKFKTVAGEEGRLLKGNKEHKAAIQELAVEYKKYLDMGGKNDLSELTAHKQTVKNITAEYESLGKAAQEAAQKQEKVAKKPASKKVTSEEADAIKSVTKQNKSLETQAGKTGAALDKEGKSAQDAAGKFRKLAKEKGAAVYANRELAKAAKETADALEREANARKERESKPNKNAVDGVVYSNNFLKWQSDIESSLKDSGNYANVYEAKISQATNGTVKFTAVVRTLDGELKKFSASVNDTGEVFSPSVSEMGEKQAADFEKRLKIAEKVREAIAAMDGEDSEKTFLNRAELERGIASIIEAEEELDKFKIKKVSLEEDGKLAITTEIKEANGQVKTFVATFDSIGDIIDKETGSIKDFAEAMESAYASGKFVVTQDSAQSSVLSRYEEIYAIAKKLGTLDVKIAGLDSTKNANQLQELTEQYRELEDVYTRLIGEFFKDPDIGEVPMESIGELSNIFETVQKQIDVINAKLKDAQENLTRGFNTKAQEAFAKFELKHQGDSNWSKISEDVEKLKQSIASIDSQDSLNKFLQNLTDVGVKLNNIGKNNKLGEILGGDRTFKDINELRDNIDSLFASIGKVDERSIRVSGTNKLTAEVKMANGEIRKMNVSLDSDGFARYVNAGIVQFGRLRSAAEGVFKGIKDMVRIYLSPSDFVRYFRQGFDVVKEIDAAMTELRKVSDSSSREITAYFDDAVESAKELGSSVNEMIRATADWQRMGYNLPDSKELAEVAILYKNVGDGIDVDTANESLVSTMQGFQLQAKDAMSVIDAFNEVSNNYAISSAGIGEALKRSAAAFNAANTDLNQAIALITAGNEIVQSPEKVGKHYANLYSNVLIIKVAISVKSQRWPRPR